MLSRSPLRRAVAILLLALALALPGRVTALQAIAAITPVPSLTDPGGYSYPRAINASGAVAGDSFGIGLIRAMSYRKGKVQPLSKSGDQGAARGITKGGTVVGYTSTGTGPQRAVTWKKGTETALPTLGGDAGEAWGVNDQGVIVGRSTVAKGDNAVWHACLWQNGKATDLGSLGGDSIALAINAAGQIVGASAAKPGGLPPDGDHGPAPGVHAVLWTNGKPTDLGTLPGGDTSIATAINAAGQIVGFSTLKAADSTAHAVRWDKGTITDLGTLPGGAASRALGINAAGQIVGVATNPKPTNKDLDGEIAVLWNQGKIVALNDLLPADSGWTTLLLAAATNDKGQIAGQGYRQAGGYAGFILTPAAS